MPTPGKKESQKEFISRCIPIVIDDGTAEDNEQATAICHSMWREAKEKKGAKVPKKQKAAAVEYKCECISCGHKLTTEEHCADVPCSECGGKMRRQSRPGAGQARRFLFAYDLLGAKPAEEDGGYRIQLFPAPDTKWQYPTGLDAKGKVKYKELKYSKKQYEQAVANFEAQDATELSTNYEHVPKTNSKFSPEEGRASGWLRKLEARDDGLFAYWVPTEDAKTFIANKEYRYFSPEWQENATDVHTGKSVGFKVTGGGLTNDPFFEGMQPLELAANKAGGLKLFVGSFENKETNMEFKELAEKYELELPEGKEEWDAESFDAALEAKKVANEAELKAAKEAADKEQTDALEVKDKEIDELKKQLETEQQASKTDLAEAVKKISELEERVKVGEDARANSAKAQLIQDALVARKIVSEESETAKMLAKNFDRFGEGDTRKLLDELPEQLDAKRHGSGAGSEEEVKLTSYELKWAKKLGLTPEDMLASKLATLAEESKEIEEE